MIHFQYLISGILSFFVSIYILVRRPKTLALKYLLIFGIIVSIWEFSSFLSKIAPTALIAADFYKITLITSQMGYPLYLLTIVNIKKERAKKIQILAIIPLLFQLITILFSGDYFSNIEFFENELGWVYKVVNIGPSFIISGSIYMMYLIVSTVFLFFLASKTEFSQLRRKYFILLISFVSFQVIGTTLTNTLIAVNIVGSYLRIGGIMQFLTFLSIFYSLGIKEEKIHFNVIDSQDFSKIYSSFLTVYYNSVMESQLGEESYKFTNFLRESNIEKQVLIERNHITLQEIDIQDLPRIIDRNLRHFDEDDVGEQVVDSYLRVLNAADKKLEWKLDAVIRSNEGFLKRSDLIYGISGGRFLEKISQDESLRDLDDTTSCLKIYRRILLPIMAYIKTDKNIQHMLSKSAITKNLRISEYGEISIDEVKKEILKLPQAQQLNIIIERFNFLLSSIYEELLSEPTRSSEVMQKLMAVLTSNKERAVKLGLYPTLLGTLATKIPQTQVHTLYSDYLEELVDERTRELKEAQQRLLKSQRMATIGEAAAMVGHDLRNPLQAIVYSIYLAKKRCMTNQIDELERLLKTIDQQVGYMNKIVSDLQDFSRPLKLEPVQTNIHELIDETFSSIQIPETVEVKNMVQRDLMLLVDPILMERVFINLFINAIQAMPSGGTLTVRSHALEDNNTISVTDTGIGIVKENLPKLFKPLFTTKSKGQGLGLAVCKRIIEIHKGEITVDSEVDNGSTFNIILPLKKTKQIIEAHALAT